MKIKIIDLLVKIANNEEVPKKIKWQGQIYEYSDDDKFYYQNGYSMYRDFYTEGNCLNEDVEIIEDSKKIEKITVREKTLGFPNGEWTARNMDKAFAIKINELIDEINNLKEK